VGTIITRKQGNKTYYLYHETYREKINKKDCGKVCGSGKSKVRCRSTYLGSAETILKTIKGKKSPVKVSARNFGLVAAAWQTACIVDLPRILAKHIKGERFGTDLWKYFFVTIINRLDSATSKEKMSRWLKKTILPELLNIKAQNFTGKKFWYATDDVISEKALREKREATNKEDPFESIDNTIFTNIEAELFSHIDQLMKLSSNVICYDTTNFFTYIEEPKRSKIANPCHSKDSKNHLNHVGLLMAVEKSFGIPLISRIYRPNCHDSKLFSHVLTDLIVSLKALCTAKTDLVLVLDKGNNSQDNFSYMKGKINWIGALVPSHHKDLLDMKLNQYQGVWEDKRYYRCIKMVMDIKCSIILTFSAVRKRKQEHTLERGIKKLQYEITKKWNSYKKMPVKITAGIKTMLKKNRYGKCIQLSIVNEKPCFKKNKKEIKTRKQRFGKSLVFSNMLDAETGYLLATYNEKNIIENDFHVLKDVTLIRFRPIRHWTDSKIRAFAFCCVVSMTLIRIMQWMTEQEGYKMSPNVLKEELADIQEIIMVYSLGDAERKITERSAVQKKLWKIFKLEKIEKHLSLHK